MNKIVTVSREFGSGGRELAKRLADILELKYIDQEIIEAIAKDTSLDEKYLTDKLESGLSLSFGRSFANISRVSNSAMLIAKQHQIIKDIAAKNDCVIVGRGADAVLSDLQPYKIFVYADMSSKLARCKSRKEEGDTMQDKDIIREIRRIDKARKSTHELYSSYAWGDKIGYNLCVNTTGIVIKEIAPHIAEIIKDYFRENYYEDTNIRPFQL